MALTKLVGVACVPPPFTASKFSQTFLVHALVVIDVGWALTHDLAARREITTYKNITKLSLHYQEIAYLAYYYSYDLHSKQFFKQVYSISSCPWVRVAATFGPLVVEAPQQPCRERQTEGCRDWPRCESSACVPSCFKSLLAPFFCAVNRFRPGCNIAARRQKPARDLRSWAFMNAAPSPTEPHYRRRISHILLFLPSCSRPAPSPVTCAQSKQKTYGLRRPYRCGVLPCRQGQTLKRERCRRLSRHPRIEDRYSKLLKRPERGSFLRVTAEELPLASDRGRSLLALCLSEFIGCLQLGATGAVGSACSLDLFEDLNLIFSCPKHQPG